MIVVERHLVNDDTPAGGKVVGNRIFLCSTLRGADERLELPKAIEAQTRLAWEHIIEALKRADMTIDDRVKVSTSLTNAKDRPTYVKLRSEILV